RERPRGGAHREVEEAGRSPARPAPDREHGIVLLEAKERVEGHDEAALGLVAAPVKRQLLELRSQIGADLARVEELGRVAGTSQAADRLPHLADRPALERKPFDLDHGLVAVVQRVQTMLAVEAEPAL